MEQNLSHILVKRGIEHIVVMPDSLNALFLKKLYKENTSIDIIQGLNETDVITICSGFNLMGSPAIALMENSGIRSIADILTRLELSHHIHNIFCLTSRGLIGEDNWWGIRHEVISKELLQSLHIPVTFIDNCSQFDLALERCMKTYRTDQTSIAICLTPDFYRSLI